MQAAINDFDSHVRKAQHLGEAERNHEKAIEALNQALEMNPRCMLALLYKGWNQGELAKNTKNPKLHQTAIATLTKAINNERLDNKQQAEAYLYRAWNQGELGQIDEAIKDLTAAFFWDSNNAQIPRTLGWCFLVKNQYDKAITQLDKAVQLDPNDPETYRFRGWCKELTNDYASALIDYKARQRLCATQGAKRAIWRVQQVLALDSSLTTGSHTEPAPQ